MVCSSRLRFLYVSVFLLLLLPLSFADSDGVSTEAEDVRGGVFGADEQDPVLNDSFPGTTNFTFINPVFFNSSVEFSDSFSLTKNLSIGEEVDEDVKIEIISGNTSPQNSFLEFLDGSNSNISWKFGKDDLNNLFISEGEVRRVTFEQGGQVGIGQSLPIGILDVHELTTTEPLFVHFRNSVSGPSNFSIRITSSQLGEIQFSDGLLPAAGLLRYDQESDTLLFRSMNNYRFLVGSSEVLRIDNSGNLGLGVTSPTARIDINTSSGTELKFSGTSSANINSATGSPFLIKTTDAQALRLGANNVDVLTVTSSGQVGIADTSPALSLKLGVAGSIGASEYCDNTGSNCFFPADVSSLSEPPICTGEGNALQYNGTSFLCTNISSGVGVGGGVEETPRVQGGKSQAECLADGGELVSIDGADDPLCSFDASVCPAGWVQFGDWSVTTAGSCSVSCNQQVCGFVQIGKGDEEYQCNNVPTTASCTTSFHSLFSNVAEETCTATTNINPSCCSATASITQIGCQ